MPGARELVELTAAAVPVAVASNSPRALLDAALLHGGLSEMFPVKLAADEVTTPKPDPKMYLTACGLLERRARRRVGVRGLHDRSPVRVGRLAARRRIAGVGTRLATPTQCNRERSVDAVARKRKGDSPARGKSPSSSQAQLLRAIARPTRPAKTDPRVAPAASIATGTIEVSVRPGDRLTARK